MKFNTLFSGSKGNATLIRTENSNILIDCGVNLKNLNKQLDYAGLKMSEIDAIFITHEHSDHIAGLKGTYNNIPVYVSSQGYFALAACDISLHSIKAFDSKMQFGDLYIETVQCPHDSMYCCGYKLTDERGKTISVITDCGTITDAITKFITSSDILLLESNHDGQMLINGKYPHSLKKRISSSYGHLSNEQAGEVIANAAKLALKNIVLGHLSQNNNTPEIAFNNALNILTANGLKEGKDIHLSVASQYYISEVIEV